MWDLTQATIQNTTISDNTGDGIGMVGLSQAIIENATISDNKDSGIVLDGSSKAIIKDTNIKGNKSEGIEIGGGSAQATIENNKIVNNGRYGVACLQRPCFDTDYKFEGAVRGSNNEISGNKEADVCPDDLKFLMTSAGGCYGPKC